MTRAAPLAVALGLGLALPACGGASTRGAAFAQDWQSDGGKSIAAVVARVGGATVPEGAGVAVGVTARGLVAIGLDGKHRWARPGAVDSRPSIAGNVVAYTGGGSLVAIDATTGKELWKTSVGTRRLRGVGDDGTLTAVSLGAEAGGGTLLLVVNRSGSTVQSWSPEPDVGVPAVLSGIVFAPWGSQYVSALEVDGGKEVGRLLGRTVMSRVAAYGGALYFGENAFVKFDSALAQAAQGGAHTVQLPERELPGKPAWFPPGTDAPAPHAGAPDSIRYYARPGAAKAGLGIDGGRFAATYFRIAVGLNAQDGALRWVRTLPAEVIAGDAAPGGFAFCDDQGSVWLVAARSGGDAGHVSLGEPLKGCTVSAGAFRVSPGPDTPALSDQIAEAIALRETQMATIQRFLLRELGTGEDPTITKTLLALASDARTQPDLLEEARNLLSARRNGTEYMLEALGRHYDFLSDVLRAPPVGPLADALAAAGEKSAAPLLAAHLNDPADTPNDVRRAARALVTLATPGELPAVKSFFALYRATADQDDLVAAVVDAAKILVQVGGAEGAALVKRAAEDPLTHPAVKTGLSGIQPPPAG